MGRKEETDEEGQTLSLEQDDSWSMEAQPLVGKGIAATLALLRQTVRFFVHLPVTAAFVCVNAILMYGVDSV